MRTIRNIAIHHSGGMGNNQKASTQHLKWRHIDDAHRTRWSFKSSLGWYGGYNFFIGADGHVLQFRAIGEETMAQRGHNFDTVSICLAGNFSKDVDKPTKKQEEAMKHIMIGLLEGKHDYKVFEDTEIKIGWGNIYPHRVIQTGHTECYGSSLTDDWAKQFIITYIQNKITVLKSLVPLYLKLLQLFKKLERKELGLVGDRECPGII